MNKENLKKTIKDLIKALKNKEASENEESTQDKLNTILNEVKKFNEATQAMNEKLEQLSTENNQLVRTVQQQQRYLEMIDAEKRASNIIITGVPESETETSATLEADGEIADTDDSKVRMLLRKIGHQNIATKETMRLGKIVQGKTRAIKVVLADPVSRKKVLEDAKQLKQAGEKFSKIYIKKDIHPAVRKEFKRLQDVTKVETNKPENTGKKVEYDHKTRTVTVDGVIIDRFKSSFFS